MVKAKTDDTPTNGKPPRNGSGSKPNGTGGVNIWDRYGGGKGSGRDDPTQ